MSGIVNQVSQPKNGYNRNLEKILCWASQFVVLTSVIVRSKCNGTRAETRFRLSPKRTSPFESARASVQSTAGSRGVRISVSNAGYTTFRGSVRVLATHFIRQFPLHFPSRASPCAIRFQTHSTGWWNYEGCCKEHAPRTGNVRNGYNILILKRTGTLSLWILRFRWDGDIKTEFTETGCEHVAMDSTQVGVQWLDLANKLWTAGCHRR